MADAVPLHSGISNEALERAELIDLLNGLLVQAEEGRIASIAYACTRPASLGESNITGWYGMRGTRDSLGLAVSILAVRYPLAVIGQSCD